MPSKVSEIVEKALSGVIESFGIELADVEYTKKQNGMNLTLYIARPDASPITIDDCEKVHRTVDPILDELDPTNGASYILNVSSLGLDRSFKNTRDYLRYLHKIIEVKLYTPINKCKSFVGELVAVDEDNITLLFNKEHITLPRKTIAVAQPHITF